MVSKKMDLKSQPNNYLENLSSAYNVNIINHDNLGDSTNRYDGLHLSYKGTSKLVQNIKSRNIILFKGNRTTTENCSISNNKNIISIKRDSNNYSNSNINYNKSSSESKETSTVFLASQEHYQGMGEYYQVPYRPNWPLASPAMAVT